MALPALLCYTSNFWIRIWGFLNSYNHLLIIFFNRVRQIRTSPISNNHKHVIVFIKLMFQLRCIDQNSNYFVQGAIVLLALCINNVLTLDNSCRSLVSDSLNPLGFVTWIAKQNRFQVVIFNLCQTTIIWKQKCRRKLSLWSLYTILLNKFRP